jgi:hypothetical protein
VQRRARHVAHMSVRHRTDLAADMAQYWWPRKVRACPARVTCEGHPGSTVSGRTPAQKGAGMSRTGDLRGSPRIDGERANARAKGDSYA